MRAKWRLMADASKDEALLAVDLYNQSKHPRRLEAFFVHMHLAWLYLLHARFSRNGVDYRYRRDNGRFIRVDGEPKTWELARCAAERWDENDPVRKNLELTIAVRNRIEHRYEEAIAVATGGYAQALLLNYEAELTSTFGWEHSLGDHLRFPVFIGVFTPEGARRLQAAQGQVPRRTRELLLEFVADLEPSVVTDQRFEFRVHLVPKLGARTEADLAMSFVREDELTEEQRAAFEELGRQGTVVVRERLRQVANLGLMKPGTAAAQIEARIPFRFNVYSEFVAAWKALGCRPPGHDPHPERTDERYCVYDEPHRDYLYKPAFVERVVRETSTAERFRKFVGRPPCAKRQEVAAAS
jgi:hypothetical protein